MNPEEELSSPASKPNQPHAGSQYGIALTLVEGRATIPPGAVGCSNPCMTGKSFPDAKGKVPSRFPSTPNLVEDEILVERQRESLGTDPTPTAEVEEGAHLPRGVPVKRDVRTRTSCFPRTARSDTLDPPEPNLLQRGARRHCCQSLPRAVDNGLGWPVVKGGTKRLQ